MRGDYTLHLDFIFARLRVCPARGTSAAALADAAGARCGRARDAACEALINAPSAQFAVLLTSPTKLRHEHKPKDASKPKDDAGVSAPWTRHHAPVVQAPGEKGYAGAALSAQLKLLVEKRPDALWYPSPLSPPLCSSLSSSLPTRRLRVLRLRFLSLSVAFPRIPFDLRPRPTTP